MMNLRDMLKKALGTGNSLHIGPVGEPGGGPFSRTLERQTMEG